MAELKLRECPFCGGEVQFYGWGNGWSVECRNDDCYVLPETRICQSRKEATDEWNHRAGEEK